MPRAGPRRIQRYSVIPSPLSNWHLIHQSFDVDAAGMSDCEPPSEHAVPRSGNRAERVFRVDFGPCALRRPDHH